MQKNYLCMLSCCFARLLSKRLTIDPALSYVVCASYRDLAKAKRGAPVPGFVRFNKG